MEPKILDVIIAIGGILFVVITIWSLEIGLNPSDVFSTIPFLIFHGIVNFFKFIFSFKGFVSICLVTIIILLIAIKKKND